MRKSLFTDNFYCEEILIYAAIGLSEIQPSHPLAMKMLAMQWKYVSTIKVQFMRENKDIAILDASKKMQNGRSFYCINEHFKKRERLRLFSWSQAIFF